MPDEKTERILRGLKAVAHAKGVTHDELAEAIGMSNRQCISRRLNGQTDMSLHEIVLLCDYLDVRLVDLEEGRVNI